MTALEKLRARYGNDIVEVVRLPGMGAKTARALYDQLGIASLRELEAAARDGRLRSLPRWSEAREQRVLEQIEAGAAPRKAPILLERALELAGTLVDALRALPECAAADVAGSLRRRVETVHDIDLIAASAEPAALTAWMAASPLAAEVTGSGETKCSIVTHDGVQVDLRVVPPDAYGNLLQHFTGSKHHNVRLREDAAARGLRVSEWGVENLETGETFRTTDEDEVYRHLGYEPIAPELREDEGELAAARERRLPQLVRAEQLLGDLHTHTDASDGKAPLARMVDAARTLGHRYYAVTDHSAGVGMGIGLDADALRRNVEAVHELAATFDDGFVLLAGAEVDVMADGSLYYPDEVLAELDWVVASLHVGQRQDRARATSRLVSAIEHPMVDVVGHPSGRLLGRREGYEFDLETVFERAAACGTFLEINCQPDRLDLRPAHARLAIEAGARLVISTDGHRPSTLGRLPLGAAMARRAWATSDDIVNTRPWEELQRLRKPGRTGPGR